jgi:hypothetical protein
MTKHRWVEYAGCLLMAITTIWCGIINIKTIFGLICFVASALMIGLLAIEMVRKRRRINKEPKKGYWP